MNKPKVIVDFKDFMAEETCTIKYKDKKYIKDKEIVMKEIAKNRCEQTISIKSRWQIFKDMRYRFMDVYKYIVIFPDGEKMIIKNVTEADPYFEELEALSRYRAKIVLKDDEIYPDFPKETDYVFQDEIKKRKRK